MWQRRFNNKMQSSLDRLNLGPRPAKNKPKLKETSQKSRQKRQMNSYATGAKRYWMAWSVNHKEKRELLLSLPPRNLKTSTYFTFSEIQRRWKLIHYFWSIALHHQEKKKWMQNLLCIGSKLPWFKFVFLLLGNDKDYDNEFLRNVRKI